MKNDGSRKSIMPFVIMIIVAFIGLEIALSTEGLSLFGDGLSLFGGGSSSPAKSSSQTDNFGHDEFDAMVIAEKIVKRQLKSPSTAEFCSTTQATITCYGDTWTVKGWVEAENSFGATVRNNFTVKFEFTSSKKYTIVSCTIT